MSEARGNNEPLPGVPDPAAAPTPLSYRSPDPATSRGLTGWVVAVCVLYGMLALPLFALAVVMLKIAAVHRDMGRPLPALVSLASAALFISLAVLLVRWMFKYIRSVSRPQR